MYLDKAVEKLTEAYSIDPGNPDSSYKLSVAYFLGNDCVRASEYLNMAEELGSPIITEAYKIELEEKCSDGNLDCSGLKTGRFRNTDERYGVTIIERTEKFQIEEDPETGHKLKLEITWIDDCTYQLKPVEVLEGPENGNCLQ